MESPFPLEDVSVATLAPSGSPLDKSLAIGRGRLVLDLGGPPENEVVGVEIDGRLVFRHLHECQVIAN